MFQDKYKDKNANLFPQRSAPLFQGNHANQFQDKNAKIFQGRIVGIPQDKFRGKNAKISTIRAVPLFQNSNARVSPGSSVLMFLDKNVRMFRDKSAEVFPARIARTLHDRCQGRSVNLFQLSPAVSALSRSVPTSPSKCVSVYLTNSARIGPSRSAARCQDKCAQQLSQHMANNTTLI